MNSKRKSDISKFYIEFMQKLPRAIEHLEICDDDNYRTASSMVDTYIGLALNAARIVNYWQPEKIDSETVAKLEALRTQARRFELTWLQVHSGNEKPEGYENVKLELLTGVGDIYREYRAQNS